MINFVLEGFKGYCIELLNVVTLHPQKMVPFFSEKVLKFLKFEFYIVELQRNTKITVRE